MSQIALMEGIFRQSQLKGKEYLVDLDIDRLVAPCYEAVGQSPRKERYGGWEATQIAGHSIGHWLSAAASMYQVTGDKLLQEKLDYALSELARVQLYSKNGYVSGFPEDCFKQVFTGDFEVGNFSLGESWVPWYSIHKIYAGLIDVYQILGMKQAFDIVIKLADWAYQGLEKLTEKQFQRMLICEHGGMNEVFADLYLLTKNTRYLKLAERFCHKAVLEPLANQQDELEGKHANTQIPKVIGAAKLYNITGNEKYKVMATFFWEQVTSYRTYAIGGNSNREHFGPEHAEQLGILTTETCNTYNMLKLTELLFEWNPSAHYYDFYERALYNHILASQDPDSGMKTYFVSSEPGHFKVYHSPENSFWCCTGTGMENPARYNRRIFEKLGDTLFVHLFIGAEGIFDNGNTIIRQETNFPYEQFARIKCVKAGDELKSIAIRKAYWMGNTMQITINGKQESFMEKNGYIYIDRSWNSGDIIEMTLPMGLHLYTAKDDEGKQVVMYGPLVLAGALGRENFPETDILEDHLALNDHPLIEVPVLISDKKVEEWVELIDKEKLIFETAAIGEPGQQKIKFKPFFDLHHERYTIYWSIMSSAQYRRFRGTDKEKKEKAQRAIVDEVIPYEQQPEIAHKLRKHKSFSGYSNELHSGWRDARDGGYFSYEMKVNPDQLMYVHVTYNKGDAMIEMDESTWEREFTIEVDGYPIAKEHVNQPDVKQRYQKSYPIPREVINGKEKVTILFRSEKGKMTGAVYGVRVLKESIQALD